MILVVPSKKIKINLIDYVIVHVIFCNNYIFNKLNLIYLLYDYVKIIFIY